MLKTHEAAPEEQHFFLSAVSPSPTQKRLALAVVIGILIVYALITGGLLKDVRSARIDAFLPAYLAAMFVCDSITAIILYAQFSIVRLRATLVIANAYLFTGLILSSYVLAFPGLFMPGNLIGGLQSSAWLYVTWHCGFPLFVIAHVLTKDADPAKRTVKGTTRAAIAQNVALTFCLVLVATFICTAGESYLPHIMLDPARYTSNWPYLVGAPIGLASTVALIALWVRRRTVLDLWLMVVMFLYLVEVPLSYYPTPARFTGGWYAVRIIGFVASSLILIVMLHEIQTLYAKLLHAVLAQRREREARLVTGDAVAASIAHEMRQPLTAMVTTADAGLRFLDRPVPNVDRAKEAFRRIAADGHRAGSIVGSIRANFRNDVKEIVPLDINELIQEALSMGLNDLQNNRIEVQAEPNTNLPKVRGNRVQLLQVFLNLIRNAVDAMAGKDGPRILSIVSETAEGDRIRVSVADTGTGISTQDVDRIFNPSYSTKADGMGMGLPICRAVIESHEGRLWFAPNSPSGAVFQFTLHADSAAVTTR